EKGVPVQAGGGFSAVVPASIMPNNTCHLLAVPHASTPKPGSAYTGPRVGFSSLSVSTVSAGPDKGTVYSLHFGDATMAAQSYLESVDSCGPAATIPDGSSAVNVSGYIINCGGNFYNSPGEFWATKELDLTRAEIQVDGQNAYGADSAASLFAKSGEAPASNELPGLRALTATLDGFNTATGEAETTEQEQLVRCAPEDVYAASASTCKAFVPTGVELTRTARFTAGGRVVTVTDAYTSTDGAQHALSLQYETDLEKPTSAWELPGEGAFRHRATNEVAPTAPAPGTVYGINDPSKAPGFENLVGALSFGSPYGTVRFDNTLWPLYGAGMSSALFEYQRAVPPAGSTAILWSYATATSLGEAQADASSSYDTLAPPAVAIASPANGAVLATPAVSVSGTATAGSGVRSVTVNGHAATLSGSTFTVAVPLAAGANALSAVLTSNHGGTATAGEVVTYAPPAAPPKPVVSDLRQSARRWREGRSLARIATTTRSRGARARRRRRARPRVGTAVTFGLNVAARVTRSVAGRLAGRRSGKRCVPQGARNRHRPHCTLTRAAGTLALTGHTGINRVLFDGRLSRTVRLRPGAYTLTVTATSSAGRSVPQRLSFTVLR
ncbi:MAG: hypothetical protein KGJ43_03380, partial [Acidobacteriota bacterium]|nr:hypothetical protein [Acidobacteriota bacterium]